MMYVFPFSVTGPPKYAEMRINLAQAIQAIGTGKFSHLTSK